MSVVGVAAAKRVAGGLGLALIALSAPGDVVSGQVTLSVRGAAIYESYDLSPSLDSMVGGVSELSLPVIATARVGGRTSVTMATGYARVSIRGAAQETSDITGLLDTEIRLEVQALRDRLTVFTTSSFPSGIASLAPVDIPLLGVLASDVIGFAAPNLGGGGAVGGGIAVAVPLGGMALGVASSFSTNGTYRPTEGEPGEFRPGAELRLRAGIEGPVARRSFLRVAGIFARRGDDQVNGERTESIGNRLSAYVSLDQGVGSSTLVLYAFDMFRSRSGAEPGPAGLAILNRGNVLAAGAQWSFPVASGTAMTPRLEIRDSRSELEGEGSAMHRLGRTVRFGVDVRRQLGRRLVGVVRGDGLVGRVAHTTLDGDADLRGFRLTLQLEMQ